MTKQRNARFTNGLVRMTESQVIKAWLRRHGWYVKGTGPRKWHNDKLNLHGLKWRHADMIQLDLLIPTWATLDEVLEMAELGEGLE